MKNLKKAREILSITVKIDLMALVLFLIHFHCNIYSRMAVNGLAGVRMKNILNTIYALENVTILILTNSDFRLRISMSLSIE